jgi:hypothetical protein
MRVFILTNIIKNIQYYGVNLLKEFYMKWYYYLVIIYLSFDAGVRYASRESVKLKHYNEVRGKRWWKEVELGRKFYKYILTLVDSRYRTIADRHTGDGGFELNFLDPKNDETDFRVSIKFGYSTVVKISFGYLETYKEYHFTDDEAGIREAFELLSEHFKKYPVIPSVK